MNKESRGGFLPVAHTYIKQHTDYEGNVMFSVPAAIAEGAAAKINFALSTAKPYEFYTFDANGDHTVDIVGGCHDVPGNYGFTLTIGDTPEQLGTIQAAEAIMIDGKIVTREDVRRMRLELDELAAMHVDKVRHIWESRNCGSCEELAEKHDALAAQVERMSTFIKLSAKKWGGIPEVEPTFWNLLRVANESPQNHLREVRAEAGRAGFIACIRLAYEIQHPPGTIHADQYAESIRSGSQP